MDERLKAALDFSNYHYSLSIQRKTLKEKFESKLTYGCNGGIFKIDRGLICFVQFLLDKNKSKDVPIIDDNGNPILINDLEDFMTEILDRYFSVSNEYFDEYQKIKKSRTVEKLIDL